MVLEYFFLKKYSGLSILNLEMKNIHRIYEIQKELRYFFRIGKKVGVYGADRVARGVNDADLSLC